MTYERGPVAVLEANAPDEYTVIVSDGFSIQRRIFAHEIDADEFARDERLRLGLALLCYHP
ncbi:hypothetical protein EON80_17930 [bacterium]|nr:MAG: hypothetical protein EON80_17930 [bacterium]